MNKAQLKKLFTLLGISATDLSIYEFGDNNEI